jgi:hypothetical protein
MVELAAAAGAAAVRGPVLSFVRSMAETDGRWELRGEYAIWCGRRAPDDAPFLLHERCEGGVRPIRRCDSHPLLHRIVAGTAFEVAHLFGFWIATDVDTVWVDAPGHGDQYCALIVGGTRDKPAQASCGWVCPRCAAHFAAASFAIPRQRFERFIAFAQDQVREFNADATRRTCPDCSNVHPLSYGFYQDLDTADERQARRQA